MSCKSHQTRSALKPSCPYNADEVDGPAAGDEVVTFLEKIDEVEYLNFDSNPWELPPASVVVKGLDSIRSYYRTWASVGDVTLTTALKVVFVGTASAGKTRSETNRVPVECILGRRVEVM